MSAGAGRVRRAYGGAGALPDAGAPPDERALPDEGAPPDAGALAGERVAVVVPVSEPPTELAALYAEFAPPLRALGCPVEFVFVLDAPWRARAAEAVALARAGEPVRVFDVAQAVGEGALLKLARARTEATILVSLPPARRVVPDALPALVRQVALGAELVVARRWPRVDSWVSRAQNRALSFVVGAVLGRRVHDVRCGVRAMRPRVLDETVIYGDFFRFLPIVAMRQGFRVVEVDAPQHPRDAGGRVQSPGVYVRRVLNVLALFVLLRFAETPLRFFGALGVASTLAGTGLLGVLLVQRIGGEPLAQRPLVLVAALLVVLGIEAIALGLVGELIVYLNARYVGQQHGYRVREVAE